jgi:hypothetical protein
VAVRILLPFDVLLNPDLRLHSRSLLLVAVPLSEPYRPPNSFGPVFSDA